MIPDPYKALDLMHSASESEIKNSYKKLALRYHPDRLVARGASEEEKKIADERFAAISAAYQLLRDPAKKAHYDHVYKYGGYDETPENSKSQCTPDDFDSKTSKLGSKGIGYTVIDPLLYLFPRTCANGRQAAASVHIPSRLHFMNPAMGGGVRFAFSSGEVTTTKDGAKKFVATTTQFVQGKKYTRVETTTIYPDGRKEIVIEGNDYIKRKWTSPSKKKVATDKDVRSVRNTEHDKADDPWYISAWNGIKRGLTDCHNPCSGELLVQ
jgi:curved DNA-binding protein CbpA